MILDGVARNKAVIAFPGYIRWAWCILPLPSRPRPGRSPANPGATEIPDSPRRDMTRPAGFGRGDGRDVHKKCQILRSGLSAP